MKTLPAVTLLSPELAAQNKQLAAQTADAQKRATALASAKELLPRRAARRIAVGTSGCMILKEKYCYKMIKILVTHHTKAFYRLMVITL